ncbi:hypothetical protein Pcinc_020413 [Petrolisthes cinctipes]|uniref:GDPGP1-like N-terminal domain-containing protein n=1 Tax=Petrolisthes cinctipes TaxID=88211 RepID=A0AAE1FI70_PETCI|nr:hypothetical protein Pcinc_020413 [Petrolisthes cinctipes]
MVCTPSQVATHLIVMETSSHQTEDNAAPTHTYSQRDFHYCISIKHGQPVLSSFDCVFLKQWEVSRALGLFKYSVEGVQTKVLPGKYQIVTQMNANRKSMKRTPAHISKVKQSFDDDKFNFTKIQSGEQLLHLIYIPHTSEVTDSSDNTKNQSVKGSVVINNAPICTSHSLLVPELSQCLPQVVTLPGLQLALHALLLSHSPDLRVAYNSLGGCASVNHLHFHTYYLPYRLYIETAACVQLAGPCYTFKDFYSQGFVFHLENRDVDLLARRVMKLVDLLLSEEVAHNLFLTRGSGLSMEGEAENKDEEYNTVRVIVWARKFVLDVTDVTMFACACCELAGHVPVYLQDKWSTLSEEDITQPLHSRCHESYSTIMPKVVRLFSPQDGGSTV